MALNQWRDHFPHQDLNHIAYGNGQIFGASANALFSYDLSSKQLERISKVNYLSDVGVSAIQYSEDYKLLIVGYNNGNIDLVGDNKQFNLPFIKASATLIGNKTINSIRLDGQLAYLSCGFGIVVVNLEKQEIKETYIIGENNTILGVNATTIFGDSIYAATDLGIYVAKADNPFLIDFSNWEKRADFSNGSVGDTISNTFVFDNRLHLLHRAGGLNILYQYSGSWQTVSSTTGKTINNIYQQNNSLYICHQNQIEVYDGAYVSQMVFSEPFDFDPRGCLIRDGVLYSASYNRGLVLHTGPTTWVSIFPRGPQGSTAFDMAYAEGKVYTVAGSASGTGWNNTNTPPGLSSYIEFGWERYGYFNTPGFLQDTVFDVLSVAVDPDDDEHLFLGVHSKKGLVEFKNGQYVTSFDNGNSTLQDRYPGRMGVADVKFDEDGHLWMTNLICSEPLSVRTNDGTWVSFDVGLTDNKAATKLLIDDSGKKWILQASTGIAVVENTEPVMDGVFQTRLLTSAPNNGGLPSLEVKCIAEDLDGEIWVGTDAGPAVFYSPDNVLDGGSINAQQILVEQDGNLQILLETEIISDIKIDGANRKWIATENSGVFLMSPDGTEEILHFTAENSPLFSNTILCVEINDETGEVFFGTDRGLISFKGSATKGDALFTDVLAYPNPVKEDYKGPIAIKGLATDSDVKITDVSGKVVFFTTAFGGQAVWDGNDFNGQRAVSGVYLVFATDQQGRYDEVTKILLVN